VLQRLDKKQIDKAINRNHSVSSLELFNNCPYKYYLRYVLGMYGKNIADHLKVGIAVHEALENKVKGVEVAVITKKLKQDIKGLEGYDDKIKNFIQNYLKDKNYLNLYEVLGVEYKFETCIQGRKFVGMIDLIIKDIFTDEIIVIDYKTSKKIHGEEKLKGLQTLLYAHIVHKEFGRCDKVVYDFVFLNKGTVQTVEVDIEKNNKTLNTKIKNIFKKMSMCFEHGEFIPKPSILCGWCDYGTQLGIDKTLYGACAYEGIWNPEYRFVAKPNTYVSKKDEEYIFGESFDPFK
jgi:ATP-dependent helicase/DNAse subunit B